MEITMKPYSQQNNGTANNGGFPKTQPPVKEGGMAGAPAGIGVTEPVNYHIQANRGGADPFSNIPPTQIGGFANPGQTEPVVGWLVCVDGPVRGVDFRIHAGYNYIGREEGDIHIHGDEQISREKHAVVAYYAKRRSFHIGPADGRNIIELNGEPVFSPVEMKANDVITIGTTKLTLIPLCGPNFDWSEGAENAE